MPVAAGEAVATAVEATAAYRYL
ncbi:MAG: hypothetical protein RIR43_1683, partial [Pseudomonadota bacterium]